MCVLLLLVATLTLGECSLFHDDPSAPLHDPDPHHDPSAHAVTVTDYYWDARDFPASPNSTDRDICGMGHIPPGTPNTVCNPDAVISAQNAEALNARVLAIRSETPCQCGDDCDEDSRDGHFNIGIAIVRNLISNPTYTDHCATDKCRVFATELRAVKWFPWLQVCDDGIVIALSDGNGVFGQAAVYTATGTKARRLISDECVSRIYQQVAPLCSVGRYYACLDDMLTFYENALGGGYCGERSGAPLSRAELAVLVLGLVLGTFLVASVLWCCRGFYREDELVVDTWVGRMCKCHLAAWESLINACCIATCCWLCGVQPINRVEEISKRHDL